MLQTDIEIPFAEGEHHLSIVTNGVKLLLKPLLQGAWVSGQSVYKRPPAPEILQNGSEVSIKQEYVRSELTNMFRVAGDSPVLTLNLSPEHPYTLTIDSLGDIAELDLGGLPLNKLSMIQKMGQANLHFSAPHPQTLPLLELDGQAARIELNELGLARFSKMILKGFATTYKLHWGAELVGDTLIEFFPKESPTTFNFPAHLAIKVRASEGQLDIEDAEFNAEAGFIAHEGEYWTQAALDGENPVLTLVVFEKSPVMLHLS